MIKQGGNDTGNGYGSADKEAGDGSANEAAGNDNGSANEEAGNEHGSADEEVRILTPEDDQAINKLTRINEILSKTSKYDMCVACVPCLLSPKQQVRGCKVFLHRRHLYTLWI